MSVIEVTNISKAYPSRRGTRVLLGRGGMGDWLRGRKTKNFEALRGISLTVEEGESLGIIGRNGSGKSTLLKILAGVTLPTTGEVVVRGRVASLLELGAGFHPMLTGRENVYLNAGLMGVRHKDVDGIIEQIVEFSGIREFIDQPVDTYSSGMYVRIAFAVSVHVNPDVFLVDEVLSVGDEEFQRKCRAKIGELRERGKTIVFVSHDLGTVNALCDRVILLNQGEMISRASPRDTINYYLRQIGHESGIHTMTEGDAEAVFSHGRIALFHEHREVTAASGIQMQLTSMGQIHDSMTADWAITARSESGCTAEGQLPRLPVKLRWTMHVADNHLVCELSMECLQEVDIELISLYCFFPTVFEQWFYGDKQGPFPDIEPGHLQWSTIVPYEAGCEEGALLPSAGSVVPPVQLKFEARNAYMGMSLLNSDFISGSRMVNIHARIPSTELPMAVGRHDLATVSVNLGYTRDTFQGWVQQQRDARTVSSKDIRARMSAGSIELYAGDTLLTASVHLHTQLHIAGMWTMSQALQWGQVRREGNALHSTGESPRFPFQQHWELEVAEGGGFEFRAYLEATRKLVIEEYNVSIGLHEGYTHWETEHESGDFPPFDPNQQDWQHLNAGYAVAQYAKATSESLCAVTLSTAGDGPPMRMTVINTGYAQRTRVLQALCSAERSDRIHLEAGRHLLFAGHIAVATKEQ